MGSQMNRFQIVLTACVFTAASAWGQAANQSSPAGNAQAAPPAAQQQPAPGTTNTAPQPDASASASGQNMISGCMKRGFANFQLSDQATNASYQIRGNGSDLAQHENHVVQIQGIPDPKDSQGGKTIFYAQKVQDSGQTCGTPDQQMAGNAPAAGQAGSAAPSANTPSPTTAPNAAWNAHASSTAAQPGVSTTPEATGQTAAAASTNADAAPSTQPDAASQAGMAGAATASSPNAQPQAGTTEENKGTPQAATPQGPAVASPSAAPTASAQQSNEQKFEGCVSGDANNLKLKTNGKTYALHGDTRPVWSLIGHKVEVTGENFNGKAIQMTAAQDLGSNCSGK